MKKIISLALTILLLLSLVGCTGGNSVNYATSRKKEKSKEISYTITNAWGYHNGYMFVQLDGETDTTYCIDKEGDIVFELDGNYECVIGFYNEIAAVKNEEDEIQICDLDGNLTSASDLGGTRFYINESEQSKLMFMDGYIPISKTHTTYSSSVDLLAILDSNLDVLQDEWPIWFYDNFTEFLDNNAQYYDGYLYYNDRILNIRTGKTCDEDEMLNNITIEYASDFWRIYHTRDDYYIYDSIHAYLTGNTKELIDLYTYNNRYRLPYEQNRENYCFRNGCCPIISVVHDSNKGNRYYFGILTEESVSTENDITFPFTPEDLNCTDGYEIYQSGENFLILCERYDKANKSWNDMCIVYNKKGKIAEKELKDEVVVPEYFSDEIIIICNEDEEYTPLTLELEPLF